MHPVPPPNLRELLGRLRTGEGVRVNAFLAEMITPGNRTKAQPVPYHPWDKIRHKTPPDGLDHLDWWLVIKLARALMQRPLPLLDVIGRPFTYALPDEVLRLLDEITQRASGQIAVSEHVTNSTTKNRYVVSSLIEEAITSSQLEGASTSRRVAKEMIRSGRAPRNRSEQMIVDNYMAMLYVSEHKDEPLTPERVCELHRIVTSGTLDDPESAGRIQSDPDPDDRVKVFGRDDDVIHVPPPVDQLPERLGALCAFANGETGGETYIPPLVRAMAVHFMAGYDHYFEDGNGRTARALFYWCMLRYGYWVTEYITISRILKKAPVQYVRSFVLTEQDDGDVTYFLIYQLQVLERALDDLDVYLTRKVAELRDTRALLSKRGDFNHRQLALIEFAVKEPDAEFTVRSHMTSHRVSDETARNDLTDLERRGLLDRTKIGRTFVWTPVANLGDLLESD